MKMKKNKYICKLIYELYTYISVWIKIRKKKLFLLKWILLVEYMIYSFFFLNTFFPFLIVLFISANRNKFLIENLC